MTEYAIHPRIGVARLGNSPQEFYIGPETTGGLPFECDAGGNVVTEGGKPQPVRKFKDGIGRIKRQAARFAIFAHDGPDGVEREVKLGEGEIEHIEWTVHLANKKAVWYSFSELQGDLNFGEWNSYENQHVPLNNPEVTEEGQRQKLIIDPGPRSVRRPGEQVDFSRDNIPEDYPFGSFPPRDPNPSLSINSLGELRMDEEGRLLVLGGFGKVSSDGQQKIQGFTGAAGFFDDISDGFVLATLTLKGGQKINLEPAWVIVGSPKYAPELVNIVNLDDTIFDVAVRYQNFYPEIHPGHPKPSKNPLEGFNLEYRPNYQRDIEPIILRPQSYRWVANVPSMVEFSSPNFDVKDASEENKANRMRYFEHFRVPVPAENYKFFDEVEDGPNQLFGKGGVPLMPLNSGDNSITNTLIYKFLTLTPTQYFFLHQWAEGKFDTDELPPAKSHQGVTALDHGVVGNCVGGPFAPGIEITWISRNPKIYSAPYQTKIAHLQDLDYAELGAYYRQSGLSTTADEGTGTGCEPGDLTKRMAIPWQADFLYCTSQTPNISDPGFNQFDASPSPTVQFEAPPIYSVYWWPPQSPQNVIAGSLDPNQQVLDAVVLNTQFSTSAKAGIVAAGQQVPYQRGVLSVEDLIFDWSRLGFIVNEGTVDYPYFVETEHGTTGLAQQVLES